MIKPIEINFNIDDPVQKQIEVMQYDSSYRLCINFFLDDVEIDLSNHIVLLNGVKPDGEKLMINGEMDTKNNRRVFIFTDNTLATPGTLNLQITITSSTEVSYTRQISILILNSINNAKSVTSTSEFKALQDLIKEVQTMKNELIAASTNLETKYTTRLTNMESMGLENQIENSNFQFGLENWGGTTSSNIEVSTLMGGYPGIRVSATALATTSIYAEYIKRNLTFIKDKYYTLSYTMMSSSGVRASDMKYNYIRDTVNGNKIISAQPEYTFTSVMINPSEYRIVVTFKALDTYTNVGIILGASLTSATESVTGFKATDVMVAQGRFAPYVHSRADTIRSMQPAPQISLARMASMPVADEVEGCIYIEKYEGKYDIDGNIVH